MSTTSNALLKYTQSRPVRKAGLGALNPLAMLVVRGSMAETVEWLLLKLCCEGEVTRDGFRFRCPRTLISGHNNEMGL